MTRPMILAGFSILYLSTVLFAQQITEYKLPDPAANPNYITVAADGTAWFTELNANKVGKITPDGKLTEYSLPVGFSRPGAIVVAPDGNIWFAETNNYQVGRMTPSGQLTEFPIAGIPGSVCVSPSGTIFFTEFQLDRVGRMTPDGTWVDFPVTRRSAPWACAADAADNVWFTELYGLTIGKLSKDGALTEYRETLDAFGDPYSMVMAPDGTVTMIGMRVSPDGVLTPYSTGTIPQDVGVLSGNLTTTADGSVWFTQRYWGPGQNQLSGAVVHIDPAGQITKYGVDNLPSGIAVDRRGVWVTVYPNTILHIDAFARRRTAGR